MFLLVIGINLLIHGVDGFLCIAGFRTELLYLIVGIIILLVYIIYYFINRLKSEVYNESIKSPVFVIDKKIISVKGYKSSEDMVTYMNYASVFTEPTENRSAFNNKRIGKHTVSAISNGACYEKLTIKLSEKCILS